MRILKDWEIDFLRKKLPSGTKVELVHMDDAQAPPSGTKGEVICVDALGSIHVEWENGSTLALIDGVDKYKVL